ncbi:uncharacterized protein LY89DRAFT_686355 [Mollisia scopiformis]|uniref:Protein-S-isoprenylcysteine O-methyltransferase n=1 Tax=Mollisia scopiformis TaxID=149040 RepID=A0A194X3D0_MOLSC|nr:uncharacterized protein LY89DRAFT_686355 [Mollisia scopiformis]KUJ14676.1 hypothetical protein LY89DRAFT_686355 [Mollisia scopiformis]
MIFSQSPDLKAISLSLYILLSTYTSFLSARPPNPTPYNSKHKDSISRHVTPRALFIRTSVKVSLGLGHTFLALTYPAPPKSICPNQSNLSWYLFTWTPHTVIAVSSILFGSCLRVYAFSVLGKNFTFRLDAPKNLVTSGLYNYVQHPAYTGSTMIFLGNIALLQRPDGVLGCWLPAWIVDATLFWRILAIVFIFGIFRGTGKRVLDEEMMLKNTFGEEWEAWHKRTKRFIPGLF